MPGGSTELVVDEHYSENDRAWKPGDTPAAGDTALFTRTTTVRQYGVDDLTTPLDGNAPPAAVHLKEILAAVRIARQASLLGVPKSITVRVLKSQ